MSLFDKIMNILGEADVEVIDAPYKLKAIKGGLERMGCSDFPPGVSFMTGVDTIGRRFLSVCYHYSDDDGFYMDETLYEEFPIGMGFPDVVVSNNSGEICDPRFDEDSEKILRALVDTGVADFSDDELKRGKYVRISIMGIVDFDEYEF